VKFFSTRKNQRGLQPRKGRGVKKTLCGAGKPGNTKLTKGMGVVVPRKRGKNTKFKPRRIVVPRIESLARVGVLRGNAKQTGFRGKERKSGNSLFGKKGERDNPTRGPLEKRSQDPPWGRKKSGGWGGGCGAGGLKIGKKKFRGGGGPTDRGGRGEKSKNASFCSHGWVTCHEMLN